MKRVRKTMQAMFLCMMMVTGLLPGMTGKAKALEVEGTNYIVSTEDDLKDLTDEIQKVTDAKIKAVDDAVKNKENEIMEI